MTRPAHSINFLTLIGAALLVPPFLYGAATLLQRLGRFEPLALAFGSLPGTVRVGIAFVCPALGAVTGLLAIRFAAGRHTLMLGRAIVGIGVLLTVLAALAGLQAS